MSEIILSSWYDFYNITIIYYVIVLLISCYSTKQGLCSGNQFMACFTLIFLAKLDNCHLHWLLNILFGASTRFMSNKQGNRANVDSNSDIKYGQKREAQEVAYLSNNMTGKSSLSAQMLREWSISYSVSKTSCCSPYENTITSQYFSEYYSRRIP